MITFAKANNYKTKQQNMDIVSRLKVFLTSLKIANSQFADTCGIPRPTISQILNGRNKKISDELISKIHVAYPALSMMWLMFGEGEMLTDSNIKFSEPKKGDNIDFASDQPMADEPVMGHLDFDSPISNSEPNNFSIPKPITKSPKIEYTEPERVVLTKPVEQNRVTAQIGANEGKRVIEIRVFYNDNSYETFVPESTKH